MTKNNLQRQAVGVDLDGSLFCGAQRLHLMPPPEKRGDPLAWEPFHMACGEDTLIEDVAKMLRALQRDGYVLVFISYRSESCRDITMDALRRHGFGGGAEEHQNLILRPGNRGMPAPEFKLDAIRRLEAERDLKFVFFIEDDLPVCQHLRANNIPCYQVRDWSTPMPCERVEMPTYHAADPKAVKEIDRRPPPVNETAQQCQRYMKEFVIRAHADTNLILRMEGIGPFTGANHQDTTLDLLAVEDWLEAHLPKVRAIAPGIFPAEVSTILAIGAMRYPGDPGYGVHGDHDGVIDIS